MANIKLIRLVKSKLKDLPIKDGQLIYTTDVPGTFLDVSDTRVSISQIHMITESERTDILVPTEGLYFTEDTFKLWYYKSEWICLTDVSVEDVSGLQELLDEMKVVYGTTTATLIPGTEGSQGKSDEVSRADHTHSLPAYPTELKNPQPLIINGEIYDGSVTKSIDTNKSYENIKCGSIVTPQDIAFMFKEIDAISNDGTKDLTLTFYNATGNQSGTLVLKPGETINDIHYLGSKIGFSGENISSRYILLG